MFGSQAKHQRAEVASKEPSPSQLNTANYGNFLKVRGAGRSRKERGSEGPSGPKRSEQERVAPCDPER